MKRLLLLITLGITIMFGFKSLRGEKLVTEDGTVSAVTLPLDLETSKVPYETATFGMG